MANLKDLENYLHTIAESEKNGGILDIPTEAMHILALCNDIRITMINEVNKELGCNIDFEQSEEITILHDFANWLTTATAHVTPKVQIKKYLEYKGYAKYCTCLNQVPKPISDTDCECFNCGKIIKY